LVPKPPQSSVAGVSTGSVGAGGGGGGSEASSSFFLPLFFFVDAAPQPAPQSSSAAGSGSAIAVPIVLRSGSVSPKIPFFLSFFPFFTPAVKPVPKLSSATPFVASTLVSDSFSSSRLPKSPKSKPEVVVVFFLFFLLPPNDHDEPVSPVSVVAALPNESAMSVVAVSFPKLQVLLAPQLLLPPPPPPHPLNPNPLSFFSVEPKSRSSLGASSLRLMSSKLLVPLVFSGT